tara:strand:+ start:239 stop:697 length:459 start_codon:yes stop_codon:yes gene_type:complete
MPSLEGKILAILLYMIPWSDCLIFGDNLFTIYSFTKVIRFPAYPILFIESFLPFGNLLLFLIIFIGIVRNNKVSYFLRFNALQCLLINIGVIIISFIYDIFFYPFESTLIVRTLTNTLLISLFAMLAYCVWSCLQGKEPDLPGISNATKMQL